MKLRIKVLLLLTGMWALISVATFTYSKITLTNEYVRIEKNEVTDDLYRTNKTLKSLFSSLKLLTSDWSQWDDVYKFMKDKNKAFIEANINDATFQNTKLNVMLFFKTDGTLLYGANYDLENKQFLPLPQELVSYLETVPSYTQLTDATKGTTGIVKLKESYAVLAAQPIFTSNGTGPADGTLVMGYFFTDKHLAKLSEILMIKVHLYPLPIPTSDVRLNQAYDALKSGQDSYISGNSINSISGYTFVKNIAGNPIGILKIQEPRILFNEGVKTINWYLGILISIGIIFLVAIWYLLKILILDRIIHVSKQLVHISKHSKFEERIHVSGRDELANMVNDVNSLLEIIQLSEKQLKHRISLNDEQLDRLSMLNKNLHNEMLRQRQIEEELRQGETVLRQMAYYDPLTGLPNRFFFEELADQLISESKHEGLNMALLFLDADKFKHINDTYGHAIGDKFLKHCAQQLKSCLSENDIISRLAGDEFIICLHNIREKAIISRIAQRILDNLSIPLLVDGKQISSTFSMGISLYPEDGKTIEELENRADIAMYYAKENTNVSYYFYNDIKEETHETE